MTELERKIMEKMGVDPSQLQPKQETQDERIKVLEDAMSILLNGVTDDE